MSRSIVGFYPASLPTHLANVISGAATSAGEDHGPSLAAGGGDAQGALPKGVRAVPGIYSGRKGCNASCNALYLSMIRSFAGQGTRDVFNGHRTPAARKTCPVALWPVAWRKLDQLNQAHVLDDLRSPPGNRLEKLRGDRQGQHSIRINERYRICFRWTTQGPEDVEIVDYHG